MKKELENISPSPAFLPDDGCEPSQFDIFDIMEGMSSISAVIKAIEQGKTDRKIHAVYVDASKKRTKHKEISYLERKSAQLGFSVEFVSCEKIQELASGTSHGGMLARCSERNIPLLSRSIGSLKSDGIYYMLEGIEDPYNFGYCIRSIYASGGDGIILPPRNWMGAAGTVARSAAGCSELIDMFIAAPDDAAQIFKRLGYRVVCAGIRDSVSLFDADLSAPLLVIVGGEKRGISRTLLDMADKIVRIDYGKDFSGSLPSASATAVFAFEILRHNKVSKSKPLK